MNTDRQSGRFDMETGVAAMILMLLASPVGSGRDPLRQPFHHESIWNMPIGSEAEYVHAKIQKATQAGMTIDEYLIVLTPEAPLLDIYQNNAGWNRNRSRCTIDGDILFRAPILADFIVSPDTWDGLTPNSGLAVLMPDGRTIKQTQPIVRCTTDYGTSRYVFGDEDLYDPGYYGAHGDVPIRQIDMRPHWDDRIALENPHKGWYHHFPDNHVNKYLIGKDADLLEFPGMDHLYIRLAWAYLEPQEGRFDWPVIDRLIDKWVGHGLGISFRISCKETSTDRVEQQFATPKWVMEAGAKGGYYRNGQPVGPDGPWEPAFDDPVFLEKLESFLRAFAARYDGKPWLRYVDIGSIGDWGEGHTHSGSRKEYSYETRKQHVDLHLKYFQVSPLVISDDYVYSLSNLQQREALHRYIVEKGISYRDDSILVNGYLSGHAGTWTVRSPGFFADVWRQMPTVFELEHYGSVKRQGNWVAAPGSSLEKFGKDKSGADFFRGALGLLHATYIGYHGYAHEWFADNPALTVELLNRCGYWYFLHHVAIPDRLEACRPCDLQLIWENRGVAPAYHDYQLRVCLAGSDTREFAVPAGNRKWMPSDTGQTFTESYSLQLPASLKPGTYTLGLKLHCPREERDVRLALSSSLLNEQGYYRLGSVQVIDKP